MSRRRPNFPHWQLLHGTFRTCDGPSWRRAAASWLGVDPGELRNHFDRDLSDEEINDLHAKLKARMDVYLLWVNTVRVPRVQAAACAVRDAIESRVEALALAVQRVEQEMRSASYESWVDCQRTLLDV
ncbi:hypothetical protein BF49_5612 [Bradyrhizobium sp.]|uniref:hypothetical protein n=1 Tax=Bradyrhizobium sp. TaxID=376 RepID=UPI0007C1E10D|nr:hypothetical protein [Bradyrhizobium sp.]CUT14532.1 hypothetical protein BF49_5612 [Bradyrhizobium sp.]